MTQAESRMSQSQVEAQRRLIEAEKEKIYKESDRKKFFRELSKNDPDYSYNYAQLAPTLARRHRR